MVYHRDLKCPSESRAEKRRVWGYVRIQIVQHPDGCSMREAICMRLIKSEVPRLLEPQLAGISALALGLEDYEEVKTAERIRTTQRHRHVGPSV